MSKPRAQPDSGRVSKPEGGGQAVEDAELVSLAAAGVGQAFEELSRRIWGWLVGSLVARGWDLTAAEDATQEAFAALYVNADRIRDPAKVRSWLLTTANRSALRAMRPELATTGVPDVADPADDLVGDVTALAEPEVFRRLARAFERLSARDRLAIRLRYGEERSPSEVAEILAVSKVAERSITMRARQRLTWWYERLPVMLPLPWLRSWWRRFQPQPVVGDLVVQAVAAAVVLAAVALSSASPNSPPPPELASGAFGPASSVSGQTDVGHPLGADPKEITDRTREAPAGDRSFDEVTSSSTDGTPVVGIGDWDVVTEHEQLPDDPTLAVTLPGDDQPLLAVYVPDALPPLELPPWEGS